MAIQKKTFQDLWGLTFEKGGGQSHKGHNNTIRGYLFVCTRSMPGGILKGGGVQAY